MNQEHQNWHINTFSKGASYDSEKEISFSQQGNGLFIEARNARPISNDGNTGSIEKIKGEELLYSNNTGLSNYECIGSISINQKIVEFWADKLNVGPGVIRIDGVVVLKSILFELRTTHPLQLDKNEACIGGEIFVTDNRVPPYIFNIEDLIASLTATPNKYFSGFDPLLYQVNLQSPLDIPVFVELINVGGGGGLPVGQYQYSIRYVNKEGDRTNWSMMTPMIPVMQSLSSESRIYPWVKTYGGPPAPSSKTAYAPKLRFRVNNFYNYDFIEVRRTAYNAGAGIEFTPIGKIVAKIDIGVGEVSVREYIDPAESNVEIALSAVDETQELVEIERAKSIRYFDRRTVLMNVEIASKDSDLTFEEINGKQGFPVIDKLYKAGYNDPYNHVYKRSFMRGEKYGFGLELFDGVGTRGFVTKIDQLKNYQFPNRRDVIAPETSNYSFGSTVTAADTSASNAVNQTHEVFDLGDPTYKSNECDFKNIVRSGKIAGLTGTRSKSKVTQLCDEDDGEIENHGANVKLGLVSSSYQPFTPVRQSDPDVTGHNYVVNHKVSAETGPLCVVSEDDQYDYRPTGFSPDYYAQGLMVAGVDNFPKWAKAFSVVRTPAAKRVVCQGLGYYALTQAKFKLIGNESLGGKETNKIWFYSPDIEQGIVSSDTLNDIIENPQNYKMQMVSPLGFFSEVYSFEDGFALTEGNCKDRIVDMINYVRVLRDGPESPINPHEDPDMGVPAGNHNYVAYDKYRNITNIPSTFSGHPDKGNREVDIAVVRRKAEGRGQFLEIEAPYDIYGSPSTGGNDERNFDNDGLKNWTEPMYIVNIIRTGADVPDLNIQKYKQTTHYQKLESAIGRHNGQPNQKYILVDERWEDCISAINPSHFGASTDRYVYIKKPDGTVNKWLNVTYKTASQRAAIIADIISLGAYNTDVKGVYTHEDIDGKGRFFNIVFDQSIYPDVDDLILVKYDKTAPIRVYGGDTYIGESIFAPLDRQANAQSNAAETQFAFGIGLPYYKWKMNPRYYTIRKTGDSVIVPNVIQDELDLTLGYFRQLCAMFTVESRAAVHLAYNQSSAPNQFFPLTNYVIRPNRWDDDKTTVDNAIYQDYVDDYTEDERGMWKWGGFRFLQQINPDYSCEPPNQFFSKPKFGYTEKTEFCTRVVWSLPRAINVQDAPGLRTFPSNNSFDLDDDQGEIKKSWDATTDRGENLYAFTNTGICLLVTKKSILSDVNAGEIAYMSADSFVKQQLWVTKDVGMYDEMWRSAAESYIPLSIEGGAETREEAIFFCNNESVFRFMGNSLVDIGRIDFHTNVYKEGIKNIGAGYSTHVTAVFDKYYQEYWLTIKDKSIPQKVNKTFVFGQKTGMWYGYNDYRFDRFTVRNNQTFAHRDLETWELNKGYSINGSPVVFEVITAASPEQFWDKEFVRVRVNSPKGQKPSRVEFYKSVDGLLQCALDPSNINQGSLYMKDYRGYEAFIPRLDFGVDPNQSRFQNRLIIYNIIHNLQSEFKVIDSSIQFKVLK